MNTGTSELGPPEAPAIERRLQFARLQLVGVPLMMLVPLLALAGVLGGAREQEERRTSVVVVGVEYEARAHYEASSRLEVSVRNVGAALLPDARVELERALLDAFAEVTTSPPVEAIDANAHVVHLGELAPGATRAVVVDFRPARTGRLRGAVRVAAGGAPRTEVPVEMLVLP